MHTSIKLSNLQKLLIIIEFPKKGIWMGMDGSPTKGEKWLHHYRVKENQIPFFTKMPGVSGHAFDN